MLGALLLNIPVLSQYGTAKPVPASSSWNPKWSEMYGPDARRLRKSKKAVKKAVEELRIADYVPAELQQAKDLVHTRSLVDELDNYQPDTQEIILFVLEAWLFYVSWRKKDDEALAMALLMLD